MGEDAEQPNDGDGRAGGEAARHPTLRLLNTPAYRRVLFGASAYTLSRWVEQLTIGWFVLHVTGSVFLTALSWAVRSLPGMLLGPVSGALADRYRRNRVLAATAGIRCGVLTVMALVMLHAPDDIFTLLCLVAVNGSVNTAHNPALQSLGAELAADEDLGHAVRTLALAQRSVGAIGALAVGLIVAAIGPGPTLGLAAAPMALAACLYGSIASRPGRGDRPFFGDVVDGMRAIARVPVVRSLLGIMAVAEILGFAYAAFLPVIAEQFLHLGVEGLGALVASSAVGAMFGIALLTASRRVSHQGRLLLVVVVCMGGLIVALMGSRSFTLSLAIVAAIGASAALIDTLQWALLQRAVDDRLRGRVLGAWNVAIGVGWVGHVGLGAAAERHGVTATSITAGSLLALTGLAGLASKRLKNA